MKKKEFNPFPLSGYDPLLFCDRRKETDTLISNTLNGVNTVLLSVRRMGKTGLLYHSLHRLTQRKAATGIYADIFDTADLRGLVNRLASAMLQAVPEKHPFGKKVMAFIRQLRPVISYDDLTGQPQVTLEYSREKQFEYTLQEIFLFLEKHDRPVVVAIDEFQQVGQYPEKNTEAILRTYIQPLKNVHFIFSGSSTHLLSEMFHDTKRPFFASTQTLELDEIDRTVYGAFIAGQFEKHDRKISPQAVEFILDFSRVHTYYTQALCNKIFSRGKTDVQLSEAQQSAHELLKQNEVVYYQYRTLLTPNQWDMLIAIAKEGDLYRPNSKAINRKYRLGPSSVVQRSMEALLNKEMIYSKETGDGKFYRVYDCFLSRWLEKMQG